MLRLMSQIATICLMLVIAAPTARAIEPPAIYDELADANRDIQAALEKAKAERKLVLLVFGANWCSDCQSFDAEMNAADLGSLIAEHYVLVKIDVGRMKKNVDVAQKYELSAKRGIPAVAVVLPDGKKLLKMDGRQMADLRASGNPAVVKFFDPNAKVSGR
jgi:thioredoxin 1